MSQRSRLAAHEYRQIIKALCNSTELFSMFREQLGVHHFGSCETYSVVYSVLSDFYSEHKTLPTKEIAFIEIESVLSKFPDEHFSVEELEDLESFLDIEYAPDTLELSSKHWAISKIKNFRSVLPIKIEKIFHWPMFLRKPYLTTLYLKFHSLTVISHH